MLLRRFKELFNNNFEPLWGLVVKIVGVLAGLTVIFTYLQAQKINTGQFISSYINTVNKYLQIDKTPFVMWILAVILIIYLWFERRKLNFVAGAFSDNFEKGLVNWEYAGEGWTTQRGEKGFELSVTNSGDGGITNVGFGWDSYEFSFECKLINNCAGWIVRALDRENYIMIQLSKVDGRLSLNPHYRVKSGWWVLSQDLSASEVVKEKVRTSEWINVKIVLHGNTVDVFMDSERVLNHHIPDPIRLIVNKEFKWEGMPTDKGKMAMQEPISQSFPNGRVGFRCYGEEHAHIRNVKVKPLFWSSRNF